MRNCASRTSGYCRRSRGSPLVGAETVTQSQSQPQHRGGAGSPRHLRQPRLRQPHRHHHNSSSRYRRTAATTTTTAERRGWATRRARSDDDGPADAGGPRGGRRRRGRRPGQRVERRAAGAALLAARGVRECKLQGCGLATLPGARNSWGTWHRRRTPRLHALDDLPASVGALRGLGGSASRATCCARCRRWCASAPRTLLGCNQLSGLPDGFGASRSCATVARLERDPYLPASFGEPRRSAAELSANALHDLPRRSQARVARGAWLRSNALSAFRSSSAASRAARARRGGERHRRCRAPSRTCRRSRRSSSRAAARLPAGGLVSQARRPSSTLSAATAIRPPPTESGARRARYEPRDRLASSLSINGAARRRSPARSPTRARRRPPPPPTRRRTRARAPAVRARRGARRRRPAKREPPRKNRSYWPNFKPATICSRRRATGARVNARRGGAEAEEGACTLALSC